MTKEMPLKTSFKDTVTLFSLGLFVSIIGIIALINTWYDMDIIGYYYRIIEGVEADFISVYRSLLADDMNNLEEYTLVIDYLKGVFSFLRYYYPAMLYMICMGLSCILVLIFKLVTHQMAMDTLKLSHLLNVKVSRHIIFFLLGVMLIKAFITDGSNLLLIAINNLLIILIVMLFLLGILFEVFMIMRTESGRQKFFLIMMSVFCLIFFKTYFVIAGFIEGTFQMRSKLNKTSNT
ncbi:DUF2232 domain-containing protein [Vallitalea pronyensis]|uniref:DUF2232 domain-containing protein n=1 Tax=Vallitalea pronyensis TaxID=1348613 RepID=A0A8J8MG26_9FIRM|nr:DUF2232 domain-containing protein [Vallitalea pronyensis]QUI20934.1 DUF2232 domain-containing protein [Vallitalea pronyensis]